MGARWKASKITPSLTSSQPLRHFECVCGDNFCGSGKKFIGAADGRDDHSPSHAPRAVIELALMRTLFLCGCAYK